MSDPVTKRMGNPALQKGAPALPGAGRPKGSTQKVKSSKLRKTLNKLREIEDKALQNIKDSVEGKEVDREVLATSKYVVSTIVVLNKAAVAEEQFKESLNDEEEDTTPVVEKPKFSLNIVK